MLLETLRNGYKIPDYTSRINNTWRKRLAHVMVQGPPVISAGTMFLLALSGCYSVGQLLLKKKEPGDITNRVAWIFAVMPSIIHFVFRYIVYGKDFKIFLATMAYQIADGNLKNYIKNNCSSIGIVLLKFLAVLMLGYAALTIGFGALDEAAYMFSGQNSIEDYNKHFSLYAKLASFGLPAVMVAMETVITEVPRMFEAWSEDRQDDTMNMIEVGKLESDSYYTFRKFISDMLIASFAGGISLLLDWIFIPDTVKPEEMTIKQTLITVVIFSILTTSLRFFYAAMTKNPHFEVSERLAVLKNELSTLPSLNHDQTKNTSETEEIEPIARDIGNQAAIVQREIDHQQARGASRQRYVTNMILQFGCLVLVIYLVELLTRELLLADVDESEHKNSVAVAQTLGVLGGYIALPIIHRGGPWIERKMTDCIESIKNNIYGFFCHRDPSRNPGLYVPSLTSSPSPAVSSSV